MKSITAKTSYEGIHCWPEAPEEVSYLRNPHRHIFNIEVQVEVYSDDRDIEFITLKHRIDDWLNLQFDENGVWQMGRLSCEQVAEMVIDLVQEKLNDKERVISCYVDEDGENGATVTYSSEAIGECKWEDDKDDVLSIKSVMDFNSYQKEAYQAIQCHHDDNKEEVMHWAIGLGEEAGEALSVIKHKYYGNQYDVEDLVGELGDVLWYIAALCTASNISMEDVAKYNIAKLHHRYPTGDFDEERSKHRHDLDVVFKTQSIDRERIMAEIKQKQKEA